MAVRLTREERKAQTRDELVAAARVVFLRRGLHRASLDEIAAEAGFTKGAVYSNFANKDELFLAVLDDHYRRRVEDYTTFLAEQPTVEDSYRAVARFMVERDAEEPEWMPLLSEFLVHAGRDEELRAAVTEVRERFLEAVSHVIERVAEHFGVEFRLPAKDIARGTSAMARGIFLDRQLSPGSVPVELFEELQAGYMRGLAVPPHERSTQ